MSQVSPSFPVMMLRPSVETVAAILLLGSRQMAVSGPVRVVGPDGYRLETRDVLVDLKQRQLASSGPVAGQMRLGQFQAGRLRADLGERKVMLDGGTRLKIVQGAVR